MTREEAGLKSEDKAVQAALTYLASLSVTVPKLKAIKKILEDQEYNVNEPCTAEFHVSSTSFEGAYISFLEAKDFIVYKRHSGRAVVKFG